MPVTDTTSVTSRPPHSRVSTTGSPPRSSPITAITMPMPAKIARLTTSARQPVRMPPLSKNSSSETIAAVAAKSAQTGRPNAWIWSRSQVSGQSSQEITVLSSTSSLPSSHSSGPITAVVSPAADELAAAIADAVVEARQQSGRPADAETLQAAAMQQEEGDDGKRDEEQPGVEALGRQPRNQQRQQQQRGEEEGQVDPPALGFRIEAVDELAELRLDERPAGADRVVRHFRQGRRCGPCRSRPHRSAGTSPRERR